MRRRPAPRSPRIARQTPGSAEPSDPQASRKKEDRREQQEDRLLQPRDTGEQVDRRVPERRREVQLEQHPPGKQEPVDQQPRAAVFVQGRHAVQKGHREQDAGDDDRRPACGARPGRARKTPPRRTVAATSTANANTLNWNSVASRHALASVHARDRIRSACTTAYSVVKKTGSDCAQVLKYSTSMVGDRKLVGQSRKSHWPPSCGSHQAARYEKSPAVSDQDCGEERGALEMRASASARTRSARRATARPASYIENRSPGAARPRTGGPSRGRTADSTRRSARDRRSTTRWAARCVWLPPPRPHRSSGRTNRNCRTAEGPRRPASAGARTRRLPSPDASATRIAQHARSCHDAGSAASSEAEKARGRCLRPSVPSRQMGRPAASPSVRGDPRPPARQQSQIPARRSTRSIGREVPGEPGAGHRAGSPRERQPRDHEAER